MYLKKGVECILGVYHKPLGVDGQTELVEDLDEEGPESDERGAMGAEEVNENQLEWSLRCRLTEVLDVLPRFRASFLPVLCTSCNGEGGFVNVRCSKSL